MRFGRALLILVASMLGGSASAQAPDPGAQAVASYRAAVADYDAAVRGDASAGARYFAAFAPTLACWYGERDQPASRVRAERHFETVIGIVDLEIVRASATEVVLLDLGTYDGPGPETADGVRHMHEKGILMRVDANGTWRIAAETNRVGRACLPAPFTFRSPTATCMRACRTEFERTLRNIEDIAASDPTSGPNGPMEETEGAADVQSTCMGRCMGSGPVPY